jgi:GNAT superfamily N-acetyltransferase
LAGKRRPDKFIFAGVSGFVPEFRFVLYGQIGAAFAVSGPKPAGETGMTQGIDPNHSAGASAGAGFGFNYYPSTWIDVWTQRNGRKLTLRPVLPQDSALLCNLMGRLSPMSRRYRFHGAVKGLSPESASAMTSVDYKKHMAFVVSTPERGGERLLADARWCLDASGDSAEFAIVVDDQWQRVGLGMKLMQTLLKSAKERGLDWMHGSVVETNAPMLTLMQQCGFACTPDRSEEGLVHGETSLRHGVEAPVNRRRSSRLRWPWSRASVTPPLAYWSQP